MEVEIIACDFLNAEHRAKVVALTSDYMNDPMGGGGVMPDEVRQRLANDLAEFPTCMIMFAKVNNNYVGIITCFANYSTFYAKPYFNIHDVSVIKEFRGKGIGRRLIEKVIEIARQRNYCKVTLEVREDNQNAKHLYNSLGFKDSIPPMHFWSCYL